MAMTYYIKRSGVTDPIAGPYTAVPGMNSMVFIDIPPAGNWTYSIWAMSDDSTAPLEVRMTLMEIKR